jgi:hypothetical protein
MFAAGSIAMTQVNYGLSGGNFDVLREEVITDDVNRTDRNDD